VWDFTIYLVYLVDYLRGQKNRKTDLQNQGSDLHTILETETKVTPKTPFIKRILLVDDDPDITLTFKASLDGHYYDKKRFEVYAYNDPLLVVKEFKPHFYDLLLTDIYMPNMSGLELCEKILELDVNIRGMFYDCIRSKYSSPKRSIHECRFWIFYRKAGVDRIFN